MKKTPKLKIDRERRQVFVNGKEQAMTKREFDVLTFLVDNDGKVISATVILEAVWGYENTVAHDMNTATVKQHISRLRGKGIEIRTVSGVGYAARLS